MDFDRDWYREKASRIAVLAHIFGIIALILMLVWLLHYRGGFNLDDYENPTRIFNVSDHIYSTYIFPTSFS